MYILRCTYIVNATRGDELQVIYTHTEWNYIHAHAYVHIYNCAGKVEFVGHFMHINTSHVHTYVHTYSVYTLALIGKYRVYLSQFNLCLL